MTKPLNVEISILKAFAIIAVVVSHHFNPFPFFFPANSYHLALFLFAAGYFHSVDHERKPLHYIGKRFMWLMSVYYLYHLYHALELHLLWKNGIELGWIAPALPELYYYPFMTFSSYGFGFPMWFVLQLFIAQIVFLFIRAALRPLKVNETILLLFFFAVALGAVVLSVAGYNKGDGNVIVLRTLFCMFYLQLGFMYKTFRDTLPIFNSKGLVAVFALQAVCIALYYKNIAYTVGSMTFGGHVLLPFIVALNAIYVCVCVARALAPSLSPSHILCRIGNNTFHICAMHMSFAFAAKYWFYTNAGKTEMIKDLMFSYHNERFWALYVTIGVLGPLFLIEFLRKGMRRLEKWVAAH